MVGVVFRRGRRNGRTLATIEVKPYARTYKEGNSIRIQESGQMAAWICQYPPILKSGEKAT